MVSPDIAATNIPNIHAKDHDKNTDVIGPAGSYINANTKKVVYSKDVEKLYPSILKERAGELVREEVMKTKMTFTNVDYHMAVRFISKSATQDEIDSWGLGKWCPRRTKSKGSRPGMTGSSVKDEKWTAGVIPPTEEGKRKVLGKVLELYVLKIFSSNVYSFMGETRVQRNGAPIGLDLSGEIGRLETGEVDREFAELCEQNKVKLDLDTRYVDDKQNVMGAIPYGFRWVNTAIVFNADWVDEDSKLPEDLHTANVMMTMANSIRPSIQFTVDVGSNYADNRVPILDMAMRMENISFTEHGTTFICPQVSYVFFKKSMARTTIMKSASAMPEKIKRETLVNELLRRLTNTTQYLPSAAEENRKVTNAYMQTMKLSGYGEKIRRETALAGIKGLQEKLRKAQEEGSIDTWRKEP